MNRLSLFSLLVSLIIVVSFETAHSTSCQILGQSEEIRRIVEAPPFEQSLIWDVEENAPVYRKSRIPIKVDFTIVPKENVTVTFLSSAPAELRDFIQTPQGVRWYKHPYNTSPTVPNFNSPNVGSILASLTASRSLGLKVGGVPITIKMGTDHPHGLDHEAEPHKVSTKEDVLDGLHRMKYLERVETQIGQDPDVYMAKDVAFIVDNKTGQGILVRSYEFMKVGHHYLPATAIPYVGRKIAELHGWNANTFWKKHFAAALGRAKAKLLVRFGLQMEFPHPQNVLIELDQDLMPTGRIIFRDGSDTVLVEYVAQGLGEGVTLKNDKFAGVANTNWVKPNWENSIYSFDQAGKDSYPSLVLSEWKGAHDEAYKNTIVSALRVNPNDFVISDTNGRLSILLRSAEGQRALKSYRERLKAEHARQMSSP